MCKFMIQMVHIVDSEEEVEEAVALDPIRAEAKLPRAKSKPATLTTQKQRTTKPKVKQETQANVKTAVIDARSISNSAFPNFARAAWANAYLPTLYHSLGCSEKPFEHYSKGPEIIKKLQAAIDVVWPGTDYRVHWGSEFCSKVSLIYCSHSL